MQNRWLCVGLNKDGKHHAFVKRTIANAYEEIKVCGAKIALIDIPIGFSCDINERKCDKLARKKIGPRKSSVFRAPCRQAIDAYKQGKNPRDKTDTAKCKNKEFAKCSLSEQTLAIAPKIVDVDCFMRGNSYKPNELKLREVHPEVCFAKLRGDTLKFSKNKKEGLCERRKILISYNLDVTCIEKSILNDWKKEISRDDILDALAAVTTGKLGYPNKFKTLPDAPLKDARGLSMEMVYFKK